MKKEFTAEVKTAVDEITGTNYKKTFSSKSETLHVRIHTFTDREKEEHAKLIESMNVERQLIIEELKERFPQYDIQESDKRYSGFINDICITIK